MWKISLIGLILAIASCSSTNENQNRNIAASRLEGEPPVSKEEYYANRGQEKSIRWTYDGYEAETYLFGKAIIKDSNRKFLKTGTKLRQYLFENNLHDTGVDEPEKEIDCTKVMYIKRRSPDGSCYFYEMENRMAPRDKKLAMQVLMGSKGTRFGRNSMAEEANIASKRDIMEPNPFEISHKLFNRKDGKTKEAKVLNLLAAAWLQAMNHDWFTHGKNRKDKHHMVKGYDGHSHFKSGEVAIPYTRSETDKENKLDKHGYDYTSRNQVTHWWDASQIYGSDEATIKKVRTKYTSNGVSTGKLMPNGKIAVDMENRRLIYDKNTKLPITGFHDNWWTGLEMIHVLFHMEHNRIIDKILMPQVDAGYLCNGKVSINCDDELFEKARLINSALIAKIHTAEWTPALLNHPMLHIAMRGNWYGLREIFGGDSPWLRARIPDHIKHVVSGLVGPETLDLYSAPFTLTEEFVAVYRMHPLIPEEITMRSAKNPNKTLKPVPVKDVIFRNAVGQVKSKSSNTRSSVDWMFSFGTSHPGGLMLNNYPTFMQNFVAERNTGTAHNDSTRMDMGAIDIFRDRERGVPRYNNFRRALGLPPIEKFEDLTDNADDVAALNDVYKGDVEKLDLLVGSLAEKDRYPGYAFGNTPFWIFAIMASRRLMADPFFSDYYTPAVYTKAGIDYVQDTSMANVIVNHYPELKDQFYKDVWVYRNSDKKSKKKVKRLVVKNAFRPWKPVYDEVKKSMEPKPKKAKSKFGPKR